MYAVHNLAQFNLEYLNYLYILTIYGRRKSKYIYYIILNFLPLFRMKNNKSQSIPYKQNSLF